MRHIVSLSRLRRSILVRNVLGTLLGRGLALSLGLLTGVVVARHLGPEGRGLFAIATLATGLGIQFGNMGLHAANTFLVAGFPDRLPRLLGNSLVAAIGMGILVGIVGAALRWIWPGAISIHGLLWWLALAGVPLGLAYLLMQSLILGIHQVLAFNLIEIISKALAGILIVAAIVAGRSTPEWMMAASLAATAAGMSWCFVKLKSRSGRIHVSLPDFRMSLGYGTRAYFAALLSFLLQRVALLLVQHNDGATEAGHFSIALMLFDIAYFLPVTVGTILFPRLCALDSPSARWALTRTAVWYVTVVMAVIVLALGMFSDLVIRLLFGQAFLPATAIFRLLLPGLLFLSVSSILMNFIGSSQMHPIVIFAPALGLMAMLLTYLSNIATQGPEWAALSTSVGYGLLLLVTGAYVFRTRPRP